MNDILEKYSDKVLININNDNLKKIVTFLQKEKCDYIEELFEDYLDIFTIEYEVFVIKYNKLNEKYNGKYLELIADNMNLIEELFYN